MISAESISQHGLRALQENGSRGGDGNNGGNFRLRLIVSLLLVASVLLCVVEQCYKAWRKDSNRRASEKKTETEVRKLLQKTTMTVQDSDLVFQGEELPDAQHDRLAPTTTSQASTQESDIGSSKSHIELIEQNIRDNDLSIRDILLQLRAPNKRIGWNLGAKNARHVGGVCAICLESYKVGDEVSWSAQQECCPHAFHTSCLCAYAKRQQLEAQERHGENNPHGKQIPCPLCRRPFLSLES
mmetsp:Transcript_4960/g.10268  ORF Transcript_4960/g.10268 Transcript_4960/m.10268 type:complete len:242 (+) Transcript_4960:115-840(+)